VLMSPTGVIQTDDKWIRTVQFGDRVLTLQHPLSVDFIPEIIDIKNVIKEAFDEGMDSVHTRTSRHSFMQRVIKLLSTNEWDNPNGIQSTINPFFPPPKQSSQPILIICCLIKKDNSNHGRLKRVW